MNPAFNSSKRFMERIRNLIVFIPFKIQHKWLLKDLGKIVDSSIYFFDPKVCLASLIVDAC